MVSTSRFMHLGLASLAGLAAIAWQPAHAQCNTSAWAQPATGAPVAGGPALGVRIYQGACGLNPVNGAAPSFVEESARHAAEGGGGAPYIARFFFYAGITGANPVVFRAYPSDAGVGTPVIQVTHNPANQNVSFAVNGSTQSTADNTATNGKWIEVTFTYNASGQFTANTRSVASGGFTTDLAGTIAPIATSAAVVESVRLGNVAGGGGTGNTSIDEYEASRQVGGTPASALTPMCRGDVDNDRDIAGPDRSAVTAAIRGTLPAARRPDCDEDGDITGADRSCVTALIRAFRTCS